MAQPTPYSRQYNFTNYQTVSPSVPLPAAQVDLELNSVKQTLDQILNNLALIQRDDTALANNSVGQDQLKDEIFIGINPPSPWVTGHSYVVNDTVTQGGVFYRCAVSHSSGVFATDLAGGKWTVIFDFNTVSFDLAGSIHGAVAKATPVDADEMPTSDSGSGFSLKKFTFLAIKTAFYSALGGFIAAGTVKATPVDGDSLALSDSASGNATKTLSWSAMKAAIFAALGPFIPSLTVKATPIDADTIIISDSAAAGVGKSVLISALKTVIAPLLVGDSGAGGTAGKAPAPAAGDAASDKSLGADGTYHKNRAQKLFLSGEYGAF